MTEQEHACFQMLRIRFRHECELLLLHLMPRGRRCQAPPAC
jgi:hypothetical protein